MIQKLGKYTIIEKLGEGSMGAVYKAYHDILDRYVAIKTMAEDIKWEPELKLRFYREARSAASLRHPNIVTIHDLGEEGKITYIVMELLEGKDLKGIIRDKDPMPLERKLSIMIQVAEGLNHAHLHGIIHRDVKPGNIHVTPDGNVKILDFGIARIPSSDLTRSGVRLGTPVYMSPEQIRGGDYDERSDIFSAGIVFYELLTYQHPFRDKNLVKTMDNILFLTNLPFQEQFPNAPAGLYPIIAKCLEKEPNKRFSSMADVARACRQLQEQLISSAVRLTEELQASMLRLREACEKPGASPRLHDLFRQAKSLLSKQETADFLSLQEMVSAFTQESILPLPKSGAPPTPTTRETKPPDYGERPAIQARPSRDQVPPDSQASQQPAYPSDQDLVRGREMFQKGEALMREDKPEDALDYLRQALGLLGPKSELVQMLTDARNRIAERKKARLARHFEAAHAAISVREFDKAIDALDNILQQEPEQPEALEMRRRATAELEAQKASLARREEGEREKALGFRLVAEKKYREGLRALRHAAELLGEDEAIRLGVAEAELEVRAEEMRARAQAEIAEALQLLRTDALDKARVRATRALELSPKHPEALDLLAKIDKALEEKRRKDRVNELYSSGQAALGRKAFDEALAAAYRAMETDPGDSRIQSLITQIEQAKEQTRSEEEVALLLSKAQDSLEARLYDDAIASAESILAIIPGHSEASRCIEQAQAKREEKRRHDEIAGLIGSAQQSFLRGDLTRCEVDANRLVQLDPQSRKGKELLQMVEQARQKALRDKLASLFQQARAALAAGDLNGAEKSVRGALDLDAVNPEAMQLSAELERARDEARRRALREQIAGILSLGRAALSAGDFPSAEKYAREALGIDSKDVEANAFLAEIEQARNEAQRRALKEQVAGILAQARVALSAGDFSSAEKCAREALGLDPRDAQAIAMLAEIEQARDEARRKALREQVAGILTQGRITLGVGDFSGAEKCAREALGLNSKDAQAIAFLAEIEQAREQARIKALVEKTSQILAQGRAALNAGNLEGAEKRAREVLGLEVENAGATSLLADVEAAREQARLKALRQKISGLLSQGLAAMRAQDLQGAEQFAKQVTDLESQNTEAQKMLADVAEARRKALMEKIAALLSDGRRALAEGDFPAATRYAREVLDLDAANPNAKGLLDEIEQARQKVLKEKITALLTQGRVALAAGEFLSASKSAREILDLDVQNADGKGLLREIEQAKQKALQERIATLLAQGRKSLQNSDFRGAGGHAQEVLKIDAQNADAKSFLAEVNRAEEQAKQAEIASLLQRSREFLNRKEFDGATSLATKATGLDPKNKEGKSLIKEIDKAKKSYEKELVKEQKKAAQKKAVSRREADLDATVPMDRLPKSGEAKTGRMTAVIIALGAFALLAAAGGGYYLWQKNRHHVVENVAEQLAAAQAGFDQKRFDKTIEITQSILAAHPDNTQARVLLDSAQLESKKLQVSNLLIEAQNYKAQNQLEDAKRVLQKILELMPAYEPALTVLSEIEATLSASKGTEEQEVSVKEWLNNAGSLLGAGKLIEAKAELDKVARLRPADPQLARLLKVYKDKSAEITRKQKDQTEVVVKQNRTGDLMKNAEDLFKQGRYADAETAVGQVIALAPQNAQAAALRGQVLEALRQMKFYEAAISGKNYDEALAALGRLEKVNLADPNLAELRRKAESSKASAKAQFTIFRLSEPGALLLDDKPIEGVDGEIEGKVISIGRHTLAVRGKTLQSSRSFDFSDGQNLIFVYNTDASPPEFRPWVPADKDLIARRKEREEQHPFTVEHTHGFLKGKCNGRLTISGLRVEYKGSDSDHNFVIPFRQLKLSVKEDKLDFTDIHNSKYSFKVADAKTGRDILQLWNKLSK